MSNLYYTTSLRGIFYLSIAECTANVKVVLNANLFVHDSNYLALSTMTIRTQQIGRILVEVITEGWMDERALFDFA